MVNDPTRIHNKFGCRYITANEFCNYIYDLKLLPQKADIKLLEYFERIGLLTPITRIHIPPEIARGIAVETKEECGLEVIQPMERDEKRLVAAKSLLNKVLLNYWNRSSVCGQEEHILDLILPEHKEFIQRKFERDQFIPWKEHRNAIWLTSDGKTIYDNTRYTHTYYHYWQVFAVASILRSGVNILYPLDNEEIRKTLWEMNISNLDINSELYFTMNFEAHNELCTIREYFMHFEAVAYFYAYKDNALRGFRDEVDERTKCLLPDSAEAYRIKKIAIAKCTMSRFNLTNEDVLNFIGQQCEWWGWSKGYSTSAVTEEYAKNIAVSIEMYQLITSENFEKIAQRLGSRAGYSKPLDIIFPDWIEEQRELVIRTIKEWLKRRLSDLPVSLSVSDINLKEFCDWLEQNKLFQYYWCFYRFAEFSSKYEDVGEVGVALELVTFAHIIEMIANQILKDNGKNIRKNNTLSKKLKLIFSNKKAYDLTSLFDRYHYLSGTKKRLRNRLKKISALSGGDCNEKIFKIILKCWAVRNEGIHLGLAEFDRIEIFEILEDLVLGSILIWFMKDLIK